MKEACHDGYICKKMESAITTNLVSGSVLNGVFSRSVLNVTVVLSSSSTVLLGISRMLNFSVVVMLHL